MALQRSKTGGIPSDAVILSEQEAVAYQTGILNKWDNLKDIFGYRYGMYALGVASFVNGVYLNNHYRWKLKLGHYGKMSTFLPVCVLPAIFSTAFHAEFILSDVVLQKTPCPVCIQTRAALIQTSLSCVFPFLLVPGATFSLAHKYGTFNLPNIVTEPKKVLRLIQKINKPISSTLVAFLIGQALLGAIVTHFEGKSVLTVTEKLLREEEEAA